MCSADTPLNQKRFCIADTCLSTDLDFLSLDVHNYRYINTTDNSIPCHNNSWSCLELKKIYSSVIHMWPSIFVWLESVPLFELFWVVSLSVGRCELESVVEYCLWYAPFKEWCVVCKHSMPWLSVNGEHNLNVQVCVFDTTTRRVNQSGSSNRNQIIL